MRTKIFIRKPAML